VDTEPTVAHTLSNQRCRINACEWRGTGPSRGSYWKPMAMKRAAWFGGEWMLWAIGLGLFRVDFDERLIGAIVGFESCGVELGVEVQSHDGSADAWG